ncbi:MAG TPA: LysM peptidoglycan-binding domain-containing protein [Stellaceae bacterium]|nr:LysM peptidoglycan-binding domain-containing protein [Stellaceae bacterium]
MLRGILLGLGLVVLLTAAAFVLIPRGDRGRISVTMATVASRPVRPAHRPNLQMPPLRPSFDIVTVAPDGTAVIAGRAAPHARVQVFAGGETLGEATADGNGEWVLVPDRPLAPGERHLTLRASVGQGPAIAAAETVAVAVPHAAPTPAAAPVAERVYVVRQGNTLWRIARELFGAGTRYLTIYLANLGQIRNPDLIYPGQVFKLPKS